MRVQKDPVKTSVGGHIEQRGTAGQRRERGSRSGRWEEDPHRRRRRSRSTWRLYLCSGSGRSDSDSQGGGGRNSEEKGAVRGGATEEPRVSGEEDARTEGGGRGSSEEGSDLRGGGGVRWIRQDPVEEAHFLVEEEAAVRRKGRKCGPAMEEGRRSAGRRWRRGEGRKKKGKKGRQDACGGTRKEREKEKKQNRKKGRRISKGKERKRGRKNCWDLEREIREEENRLCNCWCAVQLLVCRMQFFDD